jgi:hypothetical protein
VNWVGIDGYFRNPKNTFTSLFAAQLASVHVFTHDPVLVTETAVPDKWSPRIKVMHPSAVKTRQISELFKGASAPGSASAPRMLGFIWFDIDAKEDWPIDNDPVAREAFRHDATEYR